MFAAGERIVLERGERSKRARLTGTTGVVVDGAAKHGWLRVRVGYETLRWHQRDLRRVALAPVAAAIELLKGDALILVLEHVGDPRSLAAAARVCRDWRITCRQPTLWHTVDFLSFPNALGYALHLIDVRARLRSLRIGYSDSMHEDPRVLCWLLRECNTSALESARIVAITGLMSLFSCQTTDEDLGDGARIVFPTGGSLAHLEALCAMPSLSAERRVQVSNLIAGYRAVLARALHKPVLPVLAEQAPTLRSLDIGSLRPCAHECVRGLTDMRNLECLRMLTAGCIRHSSIAFEHHLVFERALLDLIPTVPKLRRLELGGLEACSPLVIRSHSLEILDLRGLAKGTYLTEVHCPRLTQVLCSEFGGYSGGLIPFILATDLVSRQTVRICAFELVNSLSVSRDHDGFGFRADSYLCNRHPEYRHLQPALRVTALWEHASAYDGSGHAKAAYYRRWPYRDGAEYDQVHPLLGLQERVEVLEVESPHSAGGRPDGKYW